MQVSRLLQYSPVRRYSALQALTHPFFDELRDGSVTLPNGVPSSSCPLGQLNNIQQSSPAPDILPCVRLLHAYMVLIVLYFVKG